MSLVRERWELEEEFSALFEEIEGYSAYQASGFTHPAWPVMPAGDSSRVLTARWGLVPFWAKTPEDARTIRTKTLNSRSETSHQLPSFRSLVNTRRCIIPVDGFFEPHRYEGKSYPFYIRRKDGRPFALAGLWDANPGLETSTFTVLTLPATGIIADIHNEKLRMPLLLPGELYARWADPGVTWGEAKAQAWEAAVRMTGELTAHPVGPLLYSRGTDTNIPEVRAPYKYGISAVDHLIAS